MRPDGPRDPTAGPDEGPEQPFPLWLDGTVIKGFGRGSKEVSSSCFACFSGVLLVSTLRCFYSSSSFSVWLQLLGDVTRKNGWD